MSVYIIVGKNFGDEGKGLATDYFAARSQSMGNSCLVIRHNGGGQAGHTVDLPDKRFVFHQLSSGSFREADTYWSQAFLPDLYKLPEELEAFYSLHGKLPRIYGNPKCRCVYINDVLINMALETSRGSNRHGSCGMGINEAVERSAFPDCCLYLGQIRNMSAQMLYNRLQQLRREYLPLRLAQLGLSLDQMGEYGNLLTDDNVLMNAADQMCSAARVVTIKEESVAHDYDDIIFEGAQGLLLDEDCLQFAPHLTSSKTGSDNPKDFLRNHLPEAAPEVVYVTRTYVTRHGAGPLPHEEDWRSQITQICDTTNIPNPWQGSLRFAPHGTPDEFFSSIRTDAEKNGNSYTVSCMVTHLNESNGAICCVLGEIPVTQWFCDSCIPGRLGRLYLSYTPYSQDIKTLETKTLRK